MVENLAIVCLSHLSVLQITRQQVNCFSSGKGIPKCELLLQWSEKTPPPCLQCKIGLIGARDHNYFLLHINPGKITSMDTIIPTARGGIYYRGKICLRGQHLQVKCVLKYWCLLNKALQYYAVMWWLSLIQMQICPLLVLVEQPHPAIQHVPHLQKKVGQSMALLHVGREG